jgi:hypothetical protein
VVVLFFSFSVSSWGQAESSSPTDFPLLILAPPYQSTPFLPRLGPLSIAPKLPPSSTVPAPESTQGLPLYTEEQAQAAIRVAAAEAAQVAVAEAVPAAVEIALKDYSRREGFKVGLWRVAALSLGSALAGSLLNARPTRGAAWGAGIGAAAGGIWLVLERWPPAVKRPLESLP